MPFDLGIVDDVVRLKAEIQSFAQRPDVRWSCSRFSRWKIFAAQEEGKTYRLMRSSSSVNSDSDGGYYLTSLVLQGGGTLGLAHAGLIAGLEAAGFRFPAIAGTSAGAIVAAGMFAGRGNNILTEVSPMVTELVGEVPMDTFVDGPRSIRRVLKKFAAKRTYHTPLYWSGLLAAVQRLLRERGLNSGQVFEKWMRTEVFEAYGLDTNEALRKRMKKIAGDLQNATSSGNNPFNGQGRLEDHILKLISTAMPTGMKFRLPQDLNLLHPEYDHTSPARLVRMSMSIPLFFEPSVMQTNTDIWSKHVFRKLAPFVSDQTAWEMAELKELIFLDGGLFSNLPTDEVANNLPGDIACISVPLVSTDTKVTVLRRNSLRGFASEAAAVANAVRLQRDRDAHSDLMDDKRNRKVIKIDTGTAHWLNFAMSAADKEELYLAGLRRVRDLLRDGELESV